MLYYDSCSSKLFFLQLVHCIIALLAAIFFLWVSTTFTGKDLLRKHSPNIESLVSCPLYRQTEGFFCGDHVAMRYVVATKPGTKLGMNFLVRGNLLLKIGWFLVVANTNYMHESCRYYTSQQGMCKSSQTKSVIISSAQRIQLQLSSDLWLSDGGQKGQHGGSWKLGSASRYRFRGAMVCKTVFGIIFFSLFFSRSTDQHFFCLEWGVEGQWWIEGENVGPESFCDLAGGWAWEEEETKC